MELKLRHVQSSMDVWAWLTNAVHDPALPTSMLTALSELFDNESCEDVQHHALHIGVILSDFFMNAVQGDWELWGGPYEEYVWGMLHAFHDWHGHMDISLARPHHIAVLYVLMSAKEKQDILPNELIAYYFEWERCVEYLSGTTGDTGIVTERDSPEGELGVTIIDRIDTVYVRGSDGLANAVANFKQGPWADLAVYAFEHRQEVMCLVA